MLFSGGGLQYSCEQGLVFSYYSHFYINIIYTLRTIMLLHCTFRDTATDFTTTTFTRFTSLVDASILTL